MTYGLMCDVCRKVEPEKEIKGWYRLAQIEYSPYDGLESVNGTTLHICPDCKQILFER